jgi:hypothetical protein
MNRQERVARREKRAQLKENVHMNDIVGEFVGNIMNHRFYEQLMKRTGLNYTVVRGLTDNVVREMWPMIEKVVRKLVPGIQ